MLTSGTSLAEALIYLLSTLAVLFLTLPIHEFAHALVAVRLGDPTPRYQGRLTVNPFAHLDKVGMLCMLIFGVGWARPVQINARNFKSPKWGMAITALAGPIANLLMAFVALLLYFPLALFFESDVTMYLAVFMFYIANISVYLAVFNLIPIPPLDGSRLLSALLPYKYYYKLMRYEQYSMIILMVLLFALSHVGLNPISILSNYVLNGITYIAYLPFSFFAR